MGDAGLAQVGVDAGGEAAHALAHARGRAVGRAPPREPLDGLLVLDALVEEVGGEVVPGRAEAPRALRADGRDDVGQLPDLVARVGVAVAEAQRPEVARLDVRHAAGRAPDRGVVATLRGDGDRPLHASPRPGWAAKSMPRAQESATSASAASVSPLVATQIARSRCRPPVWAKANAPVSANA